MNMDIIDDKKRVSMQLIQPDDTQYTFEVNTPSSEPNVYQLETILKKNSVKISRTVSTFDSLNNEIDMKLDGLKNQYSFNFGIFDEFSATGSLVNLTTNRELALVEFNVCEIKSELSMSAKWAEFWHAMKNDILGEDAVYYMVVANPSMLQELDEIAYQAMIRLWETSKHFGLLKEKGSRYF